MRTEQEPPERVQKQEARATVQEPEERKEPAAIAEPFLLLPEGSVLPTFPPARAQALLIGFSRLLQGHERGTQEGFHCRPPFPLGLAFYRRRRLALVSCRFLAFLLFRIVGNSVYPGIRERSVDEGIVFLPQLLMRLPDGVRVPREFVMTL